MPAGNAFTSLSTGNNKTRKDITDQYGGVMDNITKQRENVLKMPTKASIEADYIEKQGGNNDLLRVLLGNTPLDKRKEDFEEKQEMLNYLTKIGQEATRLNLDYVRRKDAEEIAPNLIKEYNRIAPNLTPSQRVEAANTIMGRLGEVMGRKLPLVSDTGGTQFENWIFKDPETGQPVLTNPLAELTKKGENDLDSFQRLAIQQQEFNNKLEIRKLENDESLKGLQKEKLGEEITDLKNKNNPQKSEYGSIPTKPLGGKGLTPLIGSINAEMGIAKEAPQIFKMLGDAEKIIEEHPSLGKGWANFVGSNSITRGLLGEDDKTAYEQLEKISNRVAEAYIRAKGSNITEGERETIKKGLFDVSRGAKANKYNIKSIKEELLKSYVRGKFTGDELANGYVADPSSFENYLSKNPGHLEKTHQQLAPNDFVSVRLPNGEVTMITKNDFVSVRLPNGEVTMITKEEYASRTKGKKK